MTTSRKQLGTSTGSRATAHLGKTLEKNLVAYIAAAAATGVGALALGQSAEAKIVYTPTNINVTNGLGLDLNNDGVNDFTFVSTTSGVGWYVAVKPVYSGNLIWGKHPNQGAAYASALRAGVTVRASKKLQASHTYMCDVNIETSGGPWLGAKNRYLGLKLLINGKAHYGWARLSFSACNGTLTGYAYETIANKSIKTGKTKGPDVITVEPASLGT